MRKIIFTGTKAGAMKRQDWKQAAVMILKDLRLFSSLYIARFIVWRTLRHRRKQRTSRSDRAKLVHGAHLHEEGAN